MKLTPREKDKLMIAVAAMVRSAMQRRVGADSHRGTP